MAVSNPAFPLSEITPSYRYINGKQLTDEELTILTSMNEKYAHSVAGSKHVIVTIKLDATNHKFVGLEPISEFRNHFLHESKVAGLNRGVAWLQWSGKRFFPGGLGYYPNEQECPLNKLNMFLGFAVEPLFGDVQPYINHVQQVIANGDLAIADYILDFLAHLIQKPYEKPSVAIVMKSEQGAGKGSLMKPLQQMLGSNFAQTNGAYLVTGRFNTALCNKLVVFADEVDLTHNKTADKLKAIISEDTVFLEQKGIGPVVFPNYARLIFASNHETVLKAGRSERRYLVLEPSSHVAQDKDYFNQFYDWLDDNGASHLLYFLLKRDITGFDPRRAPVTDALKQEILSNLSIMDEYILHELQKELPFGAFRASPEDIRLRLEDYLKMRNLASESEPQLRSKIGIALKCLKTPKTGKRGVNMMYQFPKPKEMRLQYAKKLGVHPDDLF